MLHYFYVSAGLFVLATLSAFVAHSPVQKTDPLTKNGRLVDIR